MPPAAAMAMDTAKNLLRREMRDRRAAIPPSEARACGERAAAHLLSRPDLGTARVVAVYAPVRGEIDTQALARGFRARGARLVYPRVVPGAELLALHLIDDEATLVPGTMGIPEPPAGAPTIAPAAVELFIVPGLAFDLEGNRLGWGRGYYDHTLAAAPDVPRAGLAFELQIVPAVPARAGDQRMDLIVTERSLRRIR